MNPRKCANACFYTSDEVLSIDSPQPLWYNL